MQNRLENGHYFGKIEIILQVLHFVRRGLYINTIEKVHIYEAYSESKYHFAVKKN